MDLHSISQQADKVGAVLAASIAFCTLIALLFKASQHLASAYLAYRRKKLIKGLLIEPSAQELSIYSKGIQTPERPEERRMKQRQRSYEPLESYLERKNADRRLLVVAIFMSLCFSVLVGFFIWFAMLAPQTFNIHWIKNKLTVLEEQELFKSTCMAIPEGDALAWNCLIAAGSNCGRGDPDWCELRKRLRGENTLEK